MINTEQQTQVHGTRCKTSFMKTAPDYNDGGVGVFLGLIWKAPLFSSGSFSSPRGFMLISLTHDYKI